MIRNSSVFEISPVISLQHLPDPDRQRDFLVIGREQRLVLCIQSDTPDALCDENMIFRTCFKYCFVDIGDCFSLSIVFFVEMGMIPGCKNL